MQTNIASNSNLFIVRNSAESIPKTQTGGVLSESFSTCVEADRQSLPLSVVQWLLDLAVAIPRSPKP